MSVARTVESLTNERSSGSPISRTIRARLFDTQTQRWVRVHVALALPPTSLEDYDYDPPASEASAASRSRKSVDASTDPEVARRTREAADPTMWLYIRRAHQSSTQRQVVAATHESATAHSLHSPGAASSSASASITPTTSPTAPVPGGSGIAKSHHHQYSTWTKLKVARLTPRAATQPLSREMRAALQLCLSDSTALTYASHSTPRCISGAGTPTASVTPLDPSLCRPLSRRESVWTEPYLPVPSSSPSDPRRRKGVTNTAAGSSAAPTASLSTTVSTTPTPMTRSPRLLQAQGSDASNSPHGNGFLSGSWQQQQQASVVDSMAELYEVEVRGATVSAAELSDAERRVLSPPHAPAGKGPRRWRFAGNGNASSSAGGGQGSSPTSGSWATFYASSKPRLGYKTAKNHFLSWLSIKKAPSPGYKGGSPTTRNAPSSSGVHCPHNVKASRSHSSASGLLGGGDHTNRSASVTAAPTPSGSDADAIFPAGRRVVFPMRFYRESDHLLLLQWFVWMHHTRYERRQRARELRVQQQQQQQRGGCGYISYDPRDIAREEAEDRCSGASDGEDHLGNSGSGAYALESERAIMEEDMRGEMAVEGGRDGGGTPLLAGADTRWESYVRRSRDPRNDLPFAHVPPLLWHSFLPIAPYVWYRCDRGFLAIDVSVHSDGGGGDDGNTGGADVLSPLRAARHVKPCTRARAVPGHHARCSSWDEVKLIVTSPLDEHSGSSSRSSSSSYACAPRTRAALSSRAAPRVPSPLLQGTGATAATATAMREPPGNSSSAAQFRDCFLCLTESHLVFYNSFGEVKCHVSLDHIGAVFFSAPSQQKHHEQPRPVSDSGGDKPYGCSSPPPPPPPPPCYPFVCFKVRSGADELTEPALLVTFTLLPLVPHAASDSMKRDTPAGGRVASGYYTPTQGMSTAPFLSQHETTAIPERKHDGCGHNSESDREGASRKAGDDVVEGEGTDTYTTRLRKELATLSAARSALVDVLRVLVPKASREDTDFDAYVDAVREGGPLYTSAGTVPFVVIHDADVVAQGVSHATSSGGGRVGRGRPPATSFTPHHHHYHVESNPGHGLLPTPEPLLVPASFDCTCGGGGKRVPDETAEHRRLLDVFSANSSLSRNAVGASAPAALHPASMEYIHDFDLTVRLALHPLPLMLEQEDLFFAPLCYRSNSQLRSPLLQDAGDAQLVRLLGPTDGFSASVSANPCGNNSDSSSLRVQQPRVEGAPVRREGHVDPAASAPSPGSPFAAVKPQKRHSALPHTRQAPR